MQPKNKLGFMQGRLSKVVNGLIQAFPKAHWRDEFLVAKSIGLKVMEWTVDYERELKNPIFCDSGRAEIEKLN